MRTSVSRAYYMAYNTVRLWLEANCPNWDADFKVWWRANRPTMEAPIGQHQRMWQYCLLVRGGHPLTQIGRCGDRARLRRTEADYHEEIPHSDEAVRAAFEAATQIACLLCRLDEGASASSQCPHQSRLG